MITTRLQIIAEIDDLISDESLSWVAKAKRLTGLSEQYWQVVFPERGTDAYAQLSDSERSARWARVRDEEEQFLRQTANPHLVLEVLDWPATGRPFLWLLPDKSKW